MKDNQNLDFNSGLKELEEIIKWFESDDIDLNESLTKFERGMELASKLKNYLGEVENRVEKIKHQFEGSGGQDTTTLTEEPEPDTSENKPDLFSV